MTEFWHDTPRLETRMREVESILIDAIQDPGYPLAQETGELILSGGKMLRPALVMIGSGFDKRKRRPAREDQRIAHVAAAIEILHTATLIHDDILDEADFRRGIPALHTKHGVANAILAGDWLFSRSFRLVADYADTKSTRILSRLVGSVCSAEIRQDLGKFSYRSSKRDYLRTIAGKTAALFSLSLHVGASEAKVDPFTTQQLRRIGYDIGMAFQIIDDILDYESDGQTLKKPVGNDLKEGLCTLPLILALQKNEAGIRPMLAPGRPLSDPEISSIIAQVSASGAVEEARTLARRYTDRALSAMASLPTCEARRELDALIRKLILRKY